MSNPTTPTPDTAQSPAVNTTQLLEQHGTVPFLGIIDTGTTAYPDPVDATGERFVDDNPQSFKAALSVLPHAGEGDLWADNEFVTQHDNATITVDTDAIKDVHGLDIASLEQHTGMTVDELIEATSPKPSIPIDTHKDIIDRRRLALRTLGFNCRFRWQIASDQYSPGNMRAFFKQKIAACQRHSATDAFGWIRHYDWGGSVTITTIYPSKSYTISPPDDVDVDFSTGELTLANTSTDDTADGESTPTNTTIYYGDQMGYDFRGQRRLWVKPIIYIPDSDVMVPTPHSEMDFTRKHTSNIMEDAIGWHEQILSELDSLSEEINQDVQRARLIAIDFDTLEFSIEDFYNYIGIGNDDYVEAAADRATAFATPQSQPTLWNLQLSLKLALIDHYEGYRAAKTYREYQELAGEILRHPASMITTAKEQHRLASDTSTDDPTTIDDSQMTLVESLEDLIDLDGITENSLDAHEAQQIEQRVQKQLPSTQEA